MTNKEKIKNYLHGRGFTLGVELQRAITDEVSPATIDRECRKLAKENEILRRRNAKNLVEYCLNKEKLSLF